MKLRDLSVVAQLRIGLGLVVALVAALGLMARNSMDIVSQQTSDLYEHPFAVRTALGDLKSDLLTIRLGMKDLSLSRGSDEARDLIAEIESARGDLSDHVEIIRARYLGPREDLASLDREIAKWDEVRAETLRHLADGNEPGARARIAEGDGQSDKVLQQYDRIDRFARSKALEFARASTAMNARLDRALAGAIAVIVLLAVGVSWLLVRRVRGPLHEISRATDAFRDGHFEARSAYASANELGRLSASFNRMAEAIQAELRAKEEAAQLTELLLQEQEPRGFCRLLLRSLTSRTKSEIGALYLLNAAGTQFDLYESIGLDASAAGAFSATALEGEIGAAAARDEIVHLEDIPENTRFAFRAASGTFLPRAVLSIPISNGGRATAVVSLASIRGYDEAALRLVTDLHGFLRARLVGVLAFQQIRDLATRLEGHNRELDAQRSELTAQAQELTQQNTELEMQKQQLDEANRLKTTFLSNMSHELRTPLNSVIALAGVLGRRLATKIPDEEHGYLSVIERNGRSLLALINDILDLSRIEAGREEMNVSAFPVTQSLSELVGMIGPLAREKEIALLTDVPDDLPLITTDREKFRHIVQNLMSNAVKFTISGSVTVSARVVLDRLRVAVRDTGIGMHRDEMTHIFEEFRQADAGTSRRFGGSGLGLAIARKYATMLGGSIEVESEYGKGSVFTLVLPIGSQEAAQAARLRGSRASSTSPTPAAAGGNRRILVVEDSEPAIIQLKDILTRQGYRVDVARNGREALAAIETAAPDAMVLDLMMPDVDGFEVLRSVRAHESTSTLPVLILTAKHVTREELSFLRSNHVQELIQKGALNQEELLTAIGRLMESAPPAEAQAAPPPGVALRARRRNPHTNRPVVLVVEDNADNLLTARVLLTGPYVVLEARNGLEGVEQARKHRPDVILMDISMPVMDGVRALQEIRNDDTVMHIPVIALTASAMKGERETILAYGFDEYVAKPLDGDELRQALRKTLD